MDAAKHGEIEIIRKTPISLVIFEMILKHKKMHITTNLKGEGLKPDPNVNKNTCTGDVKK